MKSEKWVEIKSEEELPKEDGLYLTAIEDNEGLHLGAIYNDGDWRTCAGPYGQIIAWSKPEPYERDTK